MPYSAANPPPGFNQVPRGAATEPGILQQAFAGDDEQRRRYGEGRGILTSAYDSMQPALKGLDPDLLFSQATDAIGARGKNSIESLRSSLGSRGLNPNSGAANSLLQRISFDQAQATQGAKLASEIEAQKSRERAAVLNFNAASGLADYVNQDVPMLGLDASQGIFETSVAAKQQQRALAAQERANKANFLSSILQGAMGPLSALIPG